MIETDYELNNKGYMKRAVLLSVLLGTMPLLSMAQDDLYFTPSKAEQSAYQQHKMEEDGPAFYSGIGKSSDEYNRRGQYNYKRSALIRWEMTFSCRTYLRCTVIRWCWTQSTEVSPANMKELMMILPTAEE